MMLDGRDWLHASTPRGAETGAGPDLLFVLPTLAGGGGRTPGAVPRQPVHAGRVADESRDQSVRRRASQPRGNLPGTGRQPQNPARGPVSPSLPAVRQSRTAAGHRRDAAGGLHDRPAGVAADVDPAVRGGPLRERAVGEPATLAEGQNSVPRAALPDTACCGNCRSFAGRSE